LEFWCSLTTSRFLYGLSRSDALALDHNQGNNICKNPPD
jgi:hypothetical protein